MHCGLISDLHMEEYPCYIAQERNFHKRHPDVFNSILKIPEPSKKLDILFIAGDLCEFRHVALWKTALAKVSSYAELVVIIDGNHEHWRSRYQKMGLYVSEIESEFDNVKFLNNSTIIHGGVEIFGTCLWTDFGFNEYIMQCVSDRYSPLLSDKNIKRIKWGESSARNIRPRDIQLLSVKAKKEALKWLEESKHSGNKRVFLSHYPPLPDAVEIYDNDGEIEWKLAVELSKIEYTDLSDALADNCDVTIAHGHLHGTKSYKSDAGHNVYCNPRGILRNKTPSDYKILEFTI